MPLLNRRTPWAALGLTVCILTAVSARDVLAQSADLTNRAAIEGTSPAGAAKAVEGRHEAFNRLLAPFVQDGRVDYEGFQAHESDLDRYLLTLARTDPASLTEGEQLALWINAYNAFTIKLILSRYPELSSIRDIPRRWQVRRWSVGGERYSLDDIEHEILRVDFDEPRIHFAIVCASFSCPDLAAEAYTADRIDTQLDEAARRFLANREKGFRVEALPGEGHSRAEIRVSRIFKWFRKDFERQGSLVEFLLPLVPAPERALLRPHVEDVRVRFLDYDWSLNDS
ncbi:MAG: DUF547 domain-containing protein [Gemmatimonadota bacterium]